MRCVQTSTSVGMQLYCLRCLPCFLPALQRHPPEHSKRPTLLRRSPADPCASSSALPPPRANQYSSNEIIDAGHHFFGSISHGLASIVEKAVSQWGLPNGYILGEEASGAFIGGLRYGEGTLYTRNAGDARVFGRGPRLASIMAPTVRAP